MKLSRSELVTVLEQVKGAVAEKSFLPILTHVQVSGDKVLGYDSEIGISAKLSTRLDGTFNVKAVTFLQLLKNLEDEEVDITVVDSKIKIVCGRHKSTLTQITEEFPKPNVTVKSTDWREIPAGFKEALERTLMAVSEDENNRALSAMFISGKRVYGATGQRAVRCTVEGMDVAPFLMPRKAVTELIKLGNPKRVAVRDNLAVFDFVTLTFLARLREQAEFPVKMLDGLMDGRKTKHAVPEGLQSSLTRLAIFGDAAQPCVRVDPQPLGIQLSIEGLTSSAVESIAPSPDTFEIKGVNPQFLLDALTFAESLDWGKLKAEPLYLTGETASYECLVSPMTVEK